ncbi:Protein kinase domain [Trypanosoma rangeli]|uniref:Protein kinase domain n=1 Tax=Trypanosoma rangeli TaxID=5698 RepID=A0A3R7K228_TRYRA|nr:Protein kinase domain [Trypanosoma rangeli]RNF00441.1 Protein kinase domain [Trypanosoma rangeli]|eukprot:RNF00441.1 Protein kinase domain [Trypanosoma rangeli]
MMPRRLQQWQSQENMENKHNGGGLPEAPTTTSVSATVCEANAGATTVVLLLLLDFILGCLTWDPADRLTPDEAKCHPYIASYFKGDVAQGDATTSLPTTYCIGTLYLRTHELTRGATGILEVAGKVCAHHRCATGSLMAALQPLTQLDVGLAVQPLRRFATPLRVSIRPLRAPQRAAGNARKSTQQTFATRSSMFRCPSCLSRSAETAASPGGRSRGGELQFAMCEAPATTETKRKIHIDRYLFIKRRILKGIVLNGGKQVG